MNVVEVTATPSTPHAIAVFRVALFWQQRVGAYLVELDCSSEADKKLSDIVSG